MPDNPDRWNRFMAFLSEANRNTYANEQVAQAPPLRPGWKHYHFESPNFPEFAYDDEYVGDSHFIGEEVIAENSDIVWGMNYYGGVLGKENDERAIYRFLRLALLGVAPTTFIRVTTIRDGESDVVPVRGPKIFVEGDWTYRFDCQGSIMSFGGSEAICLKNRLVYQAHVHGGFLW